MTPLEELSAEIHACRRCDRLATYLEESRGRFPSYWSRPVSGFGDPEAPLFILGLAPGLHGANRRRSLDGLGNAGTVGTLLHH